MVAKVVTGTLLGLDLIPVTVEVDVANGLPGLHIVGLPDKAVGEARERVRSAIRAVGQVLPPQRITVNLAPADLKKEGTWFDLPIAVAILSAAGQLPEPPRHSLWLGELSLDGLVQPVRGVLPVALAAGEHGIKHMVVPGANGPEAAAAGGPSVQVTPSLQAVINHLKGEGDLEECQRTEIVPATRTATDFCDIRGQAQAKRALTIAAAGGHNVLLTGPPGTGKTLLSRALAGILPTLSRSEILAVTKVHSVAGLLSSDRPLVTERPFRAPHHSISLPGLIGGGSWPRPGEMSLAHRGVLFLDEIPEFPRLMIEAMRGPLEDGFVRISRAQHSVTFPTDCLLIASENPCPCGYADDPVVPCDCAPYSILRYRRRLSGPIRDRFDLTANVPRLSFAEIAEGCGENSATIRQRVMRARERQRLRFGTERVNASLTAKELAEHCTLGAKADHLLGTAVERWRLSVRAYHRILKVARTIADLSGHDKVEENDVAEAIGYRAELVTR